MKQNKGKKLEEFLPLDKVKQINKNKGISIKASWKDPEVRRKRCEGISKSKMGTMTVNGTGNFRRRAMEYYGCKCERCGYDKYVSVLDVHHRDFNPKNNEVKNLMVVCVRCHVEVHIEAGRKFGGRSLKNRTMYMMNTKYTGINNQNESLRL